MTTQPTIVIFKHRPHRLVIDPRTPPGHYAALPVKHAGRRFIDAPGAKPEMVRRADFQVVSGSLVR